MSTDKRSPALVEAMSRLIFTLPFFAILLLDLLKLKEVDSGSGIPTAATDGHNLYVNIDWFGGLTLGERVFLLIHEVLHVVLEHPARTKLYMDRGIGPDLKAFSPTKMNRAQDYIINDWIIQSGVKDMPVGGLLNPQFGMADTADEVYCKLPDEPENPDSGDGAEGNGFDKHMPQGAQAPSKADVQRALKAAASSAKAQGKMPGAMERLVDDICEPQIDWAEQLMLATTQSAGRDELTMTRPNRKR